MSKKTANKRATKKPSITAGDVNVRTLVTILDQAFDDDGKSEGASTHRRVFADELDAQLALRENHNADALYRLFSEINDFCFVEDAIRRAGFRQGFLACRQLLVGDLDLSTLKRLAR